MIEETEQEKPIEKYEHISEICGSEDLISLNHLVFLKTEYIEKMKSINEMVHIFILASVLSEDEEYEEKFKNQIKSLFRGSFGVNQNYLRFMDSKEFLQKGEEVTMEREYPLIIICLDEECRRDESFEEKLPKKKEVFFPRVSPERNGEINFMELINERDEYYHQKVKKYDYSNYLFLDEANNIKDILTYKLAIQTIRNSSPLSAKCKKSVYEKLMKLMKKFCKPFDFEEFQNEIQKYLEINEDSVIEKHAKIINIYTKECLYGIMNRLLKEKPNIWVITYFFPIIQDLNYAFKFFSEERKKEQLRTGKRSEFYKRSESKYDHFEKVGEFPPDDFEKCDFKENSDRYIFVYRVCHSNKQTIEMFKSKEGKVIESLGFFSTSYKRHISEDFPMRNTLFIIKIPKQPLSSKYSNDYADIKSMSDIQSEEEVLFNLMSLFYVEKVEVLHKSKEENYVKYKVYLVYGEKLVNGQREEIVEEKEIEHYESIKEFESNKGIPFLFLINNAINEKCEGSAYYCDSLVDMITEKSKELQNKEYPEKYKHLIDTINHFADHLRPNHNKNKYTNPTKPFVSQSSKKEICFENANHYFKEKKFHEYLSNLMEMIISSMKNEESQVSDVISCVNQCTENGKNLVREHEENILNENYVKEWYYQIEFLMVVFEYLMSQRDYEETLTELLKIVEKVNFEECFRDTVKTRIKLDDANLKKRGLNMLGQIIFNTLNKFNSCSDLDRAVNKLYPDFTEQKKKMVKDRLIIVVLDFTIKARKNSNEQFFMTNKELGVTLREWKSKNSSDKYVTEFSEKYLKIRLKEFTSYLSMYFNLMAEARKEQARIQNRITSEFLSICYGIGTNVYSKFFGKKN